MEKIDLLESIPILNVKLSELVQLCGQYTSGGLVNVAIRNSVESMLVQERRVLDKIIHAYFVSNVYSQSTYTKSVFKTYYPFCIQRNLLDKAFKKSGINSLSTFDNHLYQLLDKYQPYQPQYSWLIHLRDYSNLGHNVLIAVSKNTIVDGISMPGMHIVSPNMNLKNVQIGNIFIDELVTENGKVVKGNIDETVKNILNINQQYLIKNTKIDVLLLCKQGMELINTITAVFLE